MLSVAIISERVVNVVKSLFVGLRMDVGINMRVGIRIFNIVIN